MRVITFFLLFYVSGSLHAQAYKDSIKLQFLRYTSFLENKEFSKSVDYVNPKFFEFVPRAKLITVMESAFNNPDIDFKIEAPLIRSIGDIQTINNTRFVKLQYSNYLSMHFKTEAEQKPDTALTRKALEAKFGKDNVTYDASVDTFRLFVTKDVIANSGDGQKWTFVVVEENQRPILERIVPIELL